MLLTGVRSRKTLLAVLVFVSTLLLGTFAEAIAEMRMFNLQHKPAAELAEMVRQLLGDDARVTSHRNTLVVNASPADLADVARLVTDYDKPMRMLRIAVAQGRSTEVDGGEINVSGQIDSRDIKARMGRPAGPADSSVFVTGGDASILITGQEHRAVTKRSASQFVSVLEGEPAMISVGKSVPFTSRLRDYSRRHPHFVETVEYQNVDTGFEVLPELQGAQAKLEVRPFMSFIEQDRPRQIVFHDLATTVIVPLGRWYDLGGSIAKENELFREIISTGSQKTALNNQVKIRVDAME